MMQSVTGVVGKSIGLLPEPWVRFLMEGHYFITRNPIVSNEILVSFETKMRLCKRKRKTYLLHDL